MAKHLHLLHSLRMSRYTKWLVFTLLFGCSDTIGEESVYFLPDASTDSMAEAGVDQDAPNVGTHDLGLDQDPHDSGFDMDSGVDAGIDASMDSGVDIGRDAGMDAGVDVGTDAGVDVGMDSGIDVDVGTDAGVDSGMDVGTDAYMDSGVDVGTDVGTDAGVDSGMDVGTDAYMDSGVDVGTDVGTDTGVDVGTDVGTDVGVDAGMDAGTDAGTDADMDSGVEICPTPWTDPYVGNCDVVNATGCSGTQVCATSQLLQGSTVILAGICQTSTTTYDLAEFQSCSGTATRCQLGLVCFFGTCRKLCYSDDGEGCEAGEYCRQPSQTWPGLGYCASQCVGSG